MSRTWVGPLVIAVLLLGCSADDGTGAQSTPANLVDAPSPEASATDTPEASDAPSSAPTSVATEEPTPVPAATPVPLPIKLVDGAGTVPQNSIASLTIRTKAASACSIDVQYESGSSEAAGLSDKKADAKGLVTWKWKIGSSTTPGTWPVMVDCTLKTRSGGLATSVRVR